MYTFSFVISTFLIRPMKYKSELHGNQTLLLSTKEMLFWQISNLVIMLCGIYI